MRELSKLLLQHIVRQWIIGMTRREHHSLDQLLAAACPDCNRRGIGLWPVRLQRFIPINARAIDQTKNIRGAKFLSGELVGSQLVVNQRRCDAKTHAMIGGVAALWPSI